MVRRRGGCDWFLGYVTGMHCCDRWYTVSVRCMARERTMRQALKNRVPFKSRGAEYMAASVATCNGVRQLGLGCLPQAEGGGRTAVTAQRPPRLVGKRSCNFNRQRPACRTDTVIRYGPDNCQNTRAFDNRAGLRLAPPHPVIPCFRHCPTCLPIHAARAQLPGPSGKVML